MRKRERSEGTGIGGWRNGEELRKMYIGKTWVRKGRESGGKKRETGREGGRE